MRDVLVLMPYHINAVEKDNLDWTSVARCASYAVLYPIESISKIEYSREGVVI